MPNLRIEIPIITGYENVQHLFDLTFVLITETKHHACEISILMSICWPRE